MIYNKFKRAFLNGDGNFDLVNDTIKVALMGIAYDPDREEDKFFADISDKEIEDTGYAAGGVELENKSFEPVDNDDVFDADDVNIDLVSNVQVIAAVVYRDTGDPETSELICVKQFIQARVAIDGSFMVEWASNGIIILR